MEHVRCRIGFHFFSWRLDLLTPALLILLVSSFGGSLYAQDCQATCRSSDSPCSGLTGSNFTNCVKRCVQGCPPVHHPPPPPLLDPGCGNRTITGTIHCTIDQPNVKQHETIYDTVQFAPNDIVEVTADGCVQTGGVGSTWKRYVTPTGPNSDHLYHGLIRIPSGTKDSALVRINTVIGRQLKVTGAGYPVDQLVLHLGYEDDGYGDNGYYAHDDGTEDQCKQGGANDGGPAHVTITIFRDVAPGVPTSRFDWDVFSTSEPDPNGFPYNPLWNWQLQPANQGQIPNTSMCHNFSRRGSNAVGVPDFYMSPYFADCTDQADVTTVDLPMGLNYDICTVSWPPRLPYTDDTFAGHVNWFPITIEGHGGWGDHGADDDYTFSYTSDGQPCPLCANGRDFIHVEFDSDETIDNFSSAEWSALHRAVDASQDAKGALAECNLPNSNLHCTSDQIAALQKTIDYPQTLFKGHAILTGMFGLDGEHNLKSELHPLFALSMLRDDYENDPSDEVWLMFVRNQGDEGFCSSQVWDSGFEDYTVKLPWHSGALSVSVNWDKTEFVGTDGTSGPTVSAIAPPSKDAGVYVTFHLGPPVPSSYIFDPGASVPFLNGALHLAWTTQGVFHPPVDRAHSTGVLLGHGVISGQLPATTAQPEENDAEEALSMSIAKLPSAQRTQVAKARVLASTRSVTVHRLAPTGAVRMMTARPAVARIARLHAIKGGPAVRKVARDQAQIKAICAATNNAPAALPAKACTAVQPPAHQ